MTVKMEDGSKTPAVIVVDSSKVDGEPRSSWRESVTKKRLILAGTSVLIAAIIIAGILIGVKFFIDGQNDIIRRTFEFASSDKEGEKVKQDVSSDNKDQLIQYHLKDNNKEIFVIEDYNRDIKILKVVAPGGDQCYVTPLNGTDRAVESMKNATSPSGAVQTLNSYYEIAQKPITEKSILGTTGKELCVNNNVYWMTPSCKNDDTAVARNKRGYCYYYYCYYCYYYYWYYYYYSWYYCCSYYWYWC